jgi:DNA-binding beta-propeller fold protein YncE
VVDFNVRRCAIKRVAVATSAVLAVVLTIGGTAQGQEQESAVNPSSPLYTYTLSIGDSLTTANAVMFDGHSTWVATERLGIGSLEKITASGQVLSVTQIGTAPIEMTFDGANVWVTNYDSSSLSIVDSQGELIKTIFLEPTAHPEGILYDGKYIWIANNGAGVNSVSKFDAASMALVANYPVGLLPDGLAFDGTYIWVTNSYSDNVMKLDRESGAIVRTYATGIYPLSILFDGKAMWIGNGDVAEPGSPPLSTASLTKLRANGGVFLGTFAAGNKVRGLASDGASIWTCNGFDNTFTRIRISDGAQLGTYPAGTSPRDIAFDGVRMWISDSGANTLTVVSPQSAPVVVTPAVAVELAFGIYTHTPAVEITPERLLPVAGAYESASGEFEPAVTSIKPRVAPAVAALGGILDGLLDNN